MNMKRIRIRTTWLAGMLLLAAGGVFAQQNPPATESAREVIPDDSPQRGLKKPRPAAGGKPQPQLDVAPSVPAAPQKVLPAATPPAGSADQLSTLPAIMVKNITVQGTTVISAPALADMVKPYENKSQTFESLNELRHTLSQYYLQRGYINSGVIIPDQKIENGNVVFKVVEGELNDIRVQGLKNLKSGYITSRIRNHVGKPLNVNDLSEAMKLLNQNPLIKQINAVLLPGDKPGESTLTVTVVEESPFYYSVRGDNYLSPSIGSERLSANVGYGNVFGLGDVIDAKLELTEGLNGAGLVYSIPVDRKGTTVSVFADYRDYIVVEEPFDEIDIESKTTKYGIAVSHPFINRLNQNLAGSLALEVKHSEHSLLNLPFSFSLGEKDGESDATVLDLGATWIKRYQDQFFSLQASLRQGMNAIGATENEGSLPSGVFSLLKGQLQYARLLPLWNSQILFHTGFQFSNDPLLSMEKFAIGGRYTVRGYRENQFVRDNGIAATLEWRISLLPRNSGQQFYVAPFVDYGSSWDKDEALTGTEKAAISSVGIGLLYDPMPNLHMELYWGSANDDVTEPAESDIQDDGIHFQVVYKSK
ncbi:MAG TPA: ShlB/FhaC/HecB family hemolysin secretion/activation protein [Gammaproteobacteria bacterium]